MISFSKIKETEEKKHSYIQGKDAAKSGLRMNQCPYVKDSKEYEEWTDGFLDFVFLHTL